MFFFTFLSLFSSLLQWSVIFRRGQLNLIPRREYKFKYIGQPQMSRCIEVHSRKNTEFLSPTKFGSSEFVFYLPMGTDNNSPKIGIQRPWAQPKMDVRISKEMKIYSHSWGKNYYLHSWGMSYGTCQRFELYFRQGYLLDIQVCLLS